MATCGCSVSKVSRGGDSGAAGGGGGSAVASAAYMTAQQLLEYLTGLVKDYRAKAPGVVTTFMVAPDGAPDWVLDREQLWNAAEAKNNRINSVLARKCLLSLPHELDAAAREQLTRDFCAYLVETFDVAVDAAIHLPSRQGDQRNHHAHLMFTTNVVTPDGFGPKTRVLDDLKTGPVAITGMREKWEALVNAALGRAGVDARISAKTKLAQIVEMDQQIEAAPSPAVRQRLQRQRSTLAAHPPQPKIGAAVTTFRRRAERLRSEQPRRAKGRPPTAEQVLASLTASPEVHAKNAETARWLDEFDKNEGARKQVDERRSRYWRQAVEGLGRKPAEAPVERAFASAEPRRQRQRPAEPRPAPVEAPERPVERVQAVPAAAEARSATEAQQVALEALEAIPAAQELPSPNYQFVEAPVEPQEATVELPVPPQRPASIMEQLDAEMAASGWIREPARPRTEPSADPEPTPEPPSPVWPSLRAAFEAIISPEGFGGRLWGVLQDWGLVRKRVSLEEVSDVLAREGMVETTLQNFATKDRPSRLQILDDLELPHDLDVGVSASRMITPVVDEQKPERQAHVPAHQQAPEPEPNPTPVEPEPDNPAPHTWSSGPSM